ncbi:FAD-dependent oxidoreductase [Escherichia coli]|nr:FAD-dependent oxidoreductase [Escherichia coli]
MLPELVGDGVLIAGDAAGMCMNLGFTIRGMDLAIAAGGSRSKNRAFSDEKRRFQ